VVVQQKVIQHACVPYHGLRLKPGSGLPIIECCWQSFATLSKQQHLLEDSLMRLKQYNAPRVSMLHGATPKCVS
jgi:hypothetical protein